MTTTSQPETIDPSKNFSEERLAGRVAELEKWGRSPTLHQ
jgi:hypothetical protein